MNKTGGVLSHINIENEDLEVEVALENIPKSEGFLREDNFKSLNSVRKSRIYLESLITGKFNKINQEITEDEENIEEDNTPQNEPLIEMQMFEVMEAWSWRMETILNMFAYLIVGLCIS